MKTIKKMTERIVIEPEEIKVYITSDGKEFTNDYTAKEHEKKIIREKQIQEFDIKYNVHYISDLNISDSRDAVCFCIKELNEQTREDIYQRYLYIKEHPKIYDELQLGWNIIVIDEYDSNSCGRWSGYDLYIAKPENIIKEKEREIKQLEKEIEELKKLMEV